MTPLELTTNSATETQAVGRTLGECLTGGEVLALCGQLGAGKTQFVKGVALGLGVDADEPVVSPTFVLMREYEGRLRLCHLDAYRLSGAAELIDLGWEELLSDPHAVIAIEWAERAAEAIPSTAIRCTLEHREFDQRSIRIDWPDPARLVDLAARLRPHG